MFERMIINFILILLLLPSCERKDNNFCHQMGRDSGYLPIQTIGEISNDSIDIWLKVTDTVMYYESVFYRIDDQETFDKLVESNFDDIKINFQEYTILIGYFHIGCSQYKIMEQRVNLNCGYFKQNCIHRLFVEYEDSYTNLIPIQYHVFVPKLPEGLRVSHYADNPQESTFSN
jgi:hypothetical protein